MSARDDLAALLRAFDVDDHPHYIDYVDWIERHGPAVIALIDAEPVVYYCPKCHRGYGEPTRCGGPHDDGYSFHDCLPAIPQAAVAPLLTDKEPTR